MTEVHQNNYKVLPFLDPAAYPLLLPHVVCLEQDIYHGSRHITSLPWNMCEFLRLCNGRNSLGELAKNTSVKTEFIAQVAPLLLWWPDPVPELPEKNGIVDRLVLCSRPEDAWLGMGGSILSEAGDKKTFIQSCFSPYSGSNYSLLYKSKEEFNLSCHDESAFAARVAGVGHSMWGIPEYSSRIPEGYSQELAPELIIDDLRRSITSSIEMLNPAEIYVPGTFSGYPDSIYLLDIALSLLAEGYIQCDLLIYEDSPAVSGQRQVDEFSAWFEGAFLSPVEFYVDITPAGIKKASLLDVFKCRLNSYRKNEWLQSDHRNAILSGIPEAEASERFWKIVFKV